MPLDLTRKFNRLAGDCRDALFNQDPTQFHFDASKRPWRKNETDANKQALSWLLANRGNVYLIWTRDSDASPWVPQYLGESKADKARERLRNHLFYRSDGTRSKLHKVKEAIGAGKFIGVTVILVTPDELRLSVEERLIVDARTRGIPLEWNR